MYQSHYFLKTQYSAPKNEVSRNAQLLEQAGFISKLMAGVYTFLPMGWRVLKKIEGIIRVEMNKAGGQELNMPALHPIENYITTGRQDIDIIFHLQSKSEKKMVLGQSHEEIIVPLVKKYLTSYRDLPLYLYQIQTKFRDELRAKSGILRTREFIMKDLYSFHAEQSDFEKYYSKMKKSYSNIMSDVGLGNITYLTAASGGTFSKYSHEFQTVTENGEDTIHLCRNCKTAVNDEIFDKKNSCPECGNKEMEKKKSIEVGNIFPLQSNFSDKFHLTFTDKQGKQRPVIMGCYGIGLGRLMGAVTEIHNDKDGIIWPKSLTPWQVHLLSLGNDESLDIEAKKTYEILKKNNIEVLYDDRQESAGKKLKDADLIGIPIRLVVSNKTKSRIEIKYRNKSSAKLQSLSQVTKEVKEYYQ